MLTVKNHPFLMKNVSIETSCFNHYKTTFANLRQLTQKTHPF